MRHAIAGLLALSVLGSRGAAMAGPPQDGGMAVHLAGLQQVPVGDVSVSVPSGASTLIWTNDTTIRVLRIVPNTATCTMQCDAGAAATANSTPIPGGYVYNLLEPPPQASCYAYCGSVSTIAVSAGR